MQPNTQHPTRRPITPQSPQRPQGLAAGAARRPAPADAPAAGAARPSPTAPAPPSPPQQPPQPQKREVRTGHGWVDFGDGRLWLDTNSGAGTWTQGYYDEANDRLVFTGRSPFTCW